MIAGKPIIEAREYTEQKEIARKARELGNWCDHLFAHTQGFTCLKSIIRGLHKEPCTKEDFLNCPFKPGTDI